MRVAGSVGINRPADRVWMYVANYGNDTSWRAGVDQMRPSRPGPAQVGVTTHETLGLLGLSFRTDASIDRVEAGRLLTWHATIGRSSCEDLGW
jgi:polyketide cyclase/dehydrase/lipid transport protein